MSLSLKQLKLYRFRILAAGLFFLFLTATWLMFHTPSRHSENFHLAIQEQLKQIILRKLQEKKPSAQNIQFQKIWTQRASEKHSLQAFFHYSFEDQESVIQVEGQAHITRQPRTDFKEELWLIDSIQTDKTYLNIQEPIPLFSDSIPSSSLKSQ